jgi:hypothetical protein
MRGAKCCAEECRVITPSKVYLAEKCLYSFRDDVPKVYRKAGPRADLGTLVHLMVQTAVIFGSPVAPRVDDAEANGMAANALAWLATMDRPTICEQGFLYDPKRDVAELGPARGEPGYDTAPSGCMRGTWDFVWAGLGEATVYDLKTGKYDGAHREQLMMQAVAASRLFKVDHVTVGFLFVRKTKFEARGVEELDADALDAEAGKLHGYARRLPMAIPEPGDHCFRCDLGKEHCPGWGAIQEVA